MPQVSVKEFASALGFSVTVPGRPYFDVETADINRPGLQFSGYFVHFSSERIQLIGNAEMTYLFEMDEVTGRKRLSSFFSFEPPCVIVTRNYELPQIMIDEARKKFVPILSTGLTATRATHIVTNYLDHIVAPSISMHGVLVDVYGVGIMLTGESGIGKSETSLELIKRGHRLVADDVVDIKCVADSVLVGSAPEMIRHLMEIRGIGIIDVRHMYGAGAVLLEKTIDLVIEMEDWQEGKAYDRLGMDDRRTKILDISVPNILVPVRPGRNLAIVVEVAARNFRLKDLGYNAAVEFDKRLSRLSPT